MPIFLGDVGSLVLKVSKEAILTAKLRNGIKVYLLSDGDNLSDHLGVMTAFFGDQDEPLTITTLLFSGDDLLPDLTAILSQPHFNIYFFDEHNREWMGVQVVNADAERCKREFGSANFPLFDIDTYQERADRLNRVFSRRDVSDDDAAFSLLLGGNLYFDGFRIIDARPQVYKSESITARPAIFTLIREDPGPQRERDIAVLLGRAFPAQSIYLNPFRSDTGKELTDILVMTLFANKLPKYPNIKPLFSYPSSSHLGELAN